MIHRLLFKIYHARMMRAWRRTHYYEAFLHHWELTNSPGAWSRYQQMQQRRDD